MTPKQAFLERSSVARFCALVPGRRVRDVVDACRSAALGFAWSAHHGWGRRDLARWLVGPYAQAAAATRSRPASPASTSTAARAHPPLEEEAIAELLAASHAQILEMLRGAWSWTHDKASARAWIDQGLVAGIVDERSDIGYAPADRPGLGLVARVRSLFIADYLTRPADYAAFAVCDDCDGATFDGGLYHVDCARPRVRTVLRRRAASPAPDGEVREVPPSGIHPTMARRVG